MKNPELLDRHSHAEPSSKRRPTRYPFLALTALFVLAGCAYDGSGSYRGQSRYPGPYRSGGYYYGGIHRDYSYGIQHGFGRSGFGHGGFGGGGRRH